MKMIILVTGAARFIGAKTSELLLEAGHTVVNLELKIPKISL